MPKNYSDALLAFLKSKVYILPNKSFNKERFWAKFFMYWQQLCQKFITKINHKILKVLQHLVRFGKLFFSMEIFKKSTIFYFFLFLKNVTYYE
jgi:hypothetical protein